MARPFEPTKERKARAGSTLGKAVVRATATAIAVVKQFKIKNPVEQHGDKFPIHLRLALECLVCDWNYGTRICVSNLNGTGGGFHASQRSTAFLSGDQA
jgi:hypothetical protein